MAEPNAAPEGYVIHAARRLAKPQTHFDGRRFQVALCLLREADGHVFSGVGMTTQAAIADAAAAAGALAPDMAAWARESLAAGDPPEEVAAEVGLSVEQLLAAAGVRRVLVERHREALSLYAAGFGYREIDVALGLPASSHGANSWSMIKRARDAGYAVRMHGHRRGSARDRFAHDGAEVRA